MENQTVQNLVQETVPNTPPAIKPAPSFSPLMQSIQTKHNGLLISVFLVFIVLSSLGGVFFLLNRRIQNSKVAINAPFPTTSFSTLPSNPITIIKDDTKTVVESTKWKTFSNTKLKFSFRYPEEWGIVSEEIVDNGPGPVTADKVTIGKEYQLSFSQSEFIYGGGRSKDFSAPRSAGLGDYLGDPKKPKGVTSRISAGMPCNMMFPETPHEALIEFNFPDQEIGGVRLVIPGLSDSDSAKFYILATNTQECTDENQEKLDSNAQKVLDTFITSKQYDQKTAINLSIFNEISKSATVY